MSNVPAVRLLPLCGLLSLFAVACGPGGQTPPEVESTVAGAPAERLRYTREFVFVSVSGDEPTIAPFVFRATDDGSALERSAIAWLGRGGTWDRFLEERRSSSRVGGVWRVVPHGALRVIAGGATELEGFRFEQNERRLRLDLGAEVTRWTEAGGTRFRVLEGTLSFGAESLEGPVLEVLSVDRLLEDDWPPSHDFDAVFLTSGDSVQLFLAEGIGAPDDEGGHAWIRTSESETVASDAEIRWLEMRPLLDARRDVPNSWTFRIPSRAIRGELTVVGQDAVFGPERGGRRAVEIRFGVEGWYEDDDGRRSVTGIVRHVQQ